MQLLLNVLLVLFLLFFVSCVDIVRGNKNILIIQGNTGTAIEFKEIIRTGVDADKALKDSAKIK